MSYVQPEDIARRLYLKKPFWFHGKPKISVEGDKRTFGKLIFDFGDETIQFNIWIKDKSLILIAAHRAVDNFATLLIQELEDN